MRDRSLTGDGEKVDVAIVSNKGALERLFVDAELTLNALKHEFLYGEWAKDADHQRALELAIVELNRLEHAANLEIRMENNRHKNIVDKLQLEHEITTEQADQNHGHDKALLDYKNALDRLKADATEEEILNAIEKVRSRIKS